MIMPAEVQDHSQSAFGRSEVGKQILALVVTAETAQPLSREALRLAVLEVRALVARLRVLSTPNGHGEAPSLDAELVALLDQDILEHLEEGVNPDLVAHREHQAVVDRLKLLLSQPQVLDEYASIYNILAKEVAQCKSLIAMHSKTSDADSRVAIVRQLSRSLSTLVQWCEDEEQNIHNQIVREGRGYRESDKKVLAKLKGYKDSCDTKLSTILSQDVEAQIQVRRDQIALDRATLKRNVPIEMINRAQALSTKGYITTPSRKILLYGDAQKPVQSIVGALRKRHNVELFGPTGTGKTKMAVEAGRIFSGKEPVVISGASGLGTYHFWGKVISEGGQRDPGVLIKCLKEGRVLVIDEDNRIDPRILAAIKFALSLKVGDIFTHPETGEEIVVPPGFGMIVTRNEHGKHHKDRFALTREYRREFVHGSFEVGYFTPEEVYDRFLIPQLSNDDGSMDLTENDVGGKTNDPGKRSPLLALLLAAEKVQQLYRENKMADGVMESGFLIDFFDDWQEQHIRTGCSFLDYIETRLLAFVRRPIGNPARRQIIEVLVGQGFFKTHSAADFKPLEEPEPVNQTTLDGWRHGGTAVFRSDPSTPKLDTVAVALLDPFDKRQLQRPPHPLEAQVHNFKQVYNDVCTRKGIRPVPFDAHTLSSRRQQIIDGLKGHVQRSSMRNKAAVLALLDRILVPGMTDEKFIEEMIGTDSRGLLLMI